MSYTVLARKWRPKNFSELVGQTHVMQALGNALDQNRLHHAYLFTGTRGVGKTTIARIFAKALNCEQGISSNPCGVCSTCQAINEGRFVDLIEVDAASRTKVEDTREILDNVQYAPTQGKFKVYLIDEVHMLSKSSFNALLKTLEEPPAHVKFLLATTDPHKLPITVLSRCLQFNLLRLTTTQIQNHLAHILQAENLEFDASALALIAKSADGSVRDSLSLLDQAIAYCGGKLEFLPVQTMLGLVDQGQVKLILQALLENSAASVREILQSLASFGANYDALLNQMLESLHQIAQTQILGSPIEDAQLAAEDLQFFAQNLSPEAVQMYYQIGLLGRKEINLAPDIRVGFEMTLLRMLAFAPAGSKAVPIVPVAKPAAETAATSQVADTTRPGYAQEMANQAAQPSQTAQNIVAETPNPAQQFQPEISVPSPVPTPAPQATAPIAEPAQTLSPAQGFAGIQELLKKKQLNSGQAAASKPVQAPEPVHQPISPTPIEQAVDAFEPVQQFDDYAQNFAQPAYDFADDLNWQPAEPADNLHLVESKFSAPVAQPIIQPTIQPAQQQSVAAQPGLVAEETIQEIPQEATQEISQEPAAIQPAQLISKPQAATIENWVQLVAELELSGMALELARQSMLLATTANSWSLSTNPEAIAVQNPTAMQGLLKAAQAKFGQDFVINYLEFDGEYQTPTSYDSAQQKNRLQQAVESIKQDQNIQILQQALTGQLLENSIKPIG